MSTGGTALDGGRGGRAGRKFFLSSHRCPEVDMLPHRNAETQIPPLCLQGQCEANYLDVSTCRSEDEEEEEEEEEEEGSISDWSEEDLSLHFSPSILLPSDDEDTDPENSFECVDITVDAQEREGPKMVPKRQIHLKRKDAEDINNEKTEKLQVMLKDGATEGTVPNGEISANELLCSTVHQRSDLLLRQHSMPASLHTHSTTSADVDRGYRGLVAGANQGCDVGGNSRQRLQKSISLDETKTKMASCIIKSILSKKMQAERNNCKTSHQQKKPVALPALPQSADQQRVKPEGGSKPGGGVFKGPAHVVRDMRSVVKNTYSLSFSTAPSTQSNRPKSFKVIGQEESPPPTYQQAVEVKGHEERKRSSKASVYSRVAATLGQLEDRNQSNGLPITQQRRGSEPIINRHKVGDVTWSVELLDSPTNSPVSNHLSELSQSKRAGGVNHQEGTSLPAPVFTEPPPPSPSTSRHLEVTQTPLPAQENSSILGVSSQQILHPCFYTPTALPAFPSTMHPQLGKVSYVHNPLSYIQTQLQPPPPATFHLLRRSEENQNSSTGNTSNQHDHCIGTCSPHQTQNHRTRTTEDQESSSNAATSTPHEQQKHQQQFVCSVQGFLPAQVGGDLLVDITGSTAPPGAILSGPAPCQMMLDPKNGQCFYVDTPPQPQRKMLLDPETGQYVQVFLPASSSAPNNSVYPVRFANPAPFAPAMINHTPTVLSVMQFQPTVGMPSLYASPCLPFTLHTPSVNFTHTAP